MTFLYEACRLIPENIKNKVIITQNKLQQNASKLGELWYGNEFVFIKPRLFNAGRVAFHLRQSRSGH